MNLDPDILARIKTALRLNPEGMGLAALAGDLQVAPNVMTEHLNYLCGNQEVRMQGHDDLAIYAIGKGILAAAMLRFSGGMIALLDARRRVIQMNDAFQELCGQTGVPRVGCGISGAVADLLADLPVEDFLEHPEQQTPRDFIRFLQHDGKDRFFQVKLAPWPFDDGSWGMVILIDDSTAWRCAELALAESQHLFRDVLQNIQDVFYRSDNEGNLILASDSLARMLDYDSIDECLGKNAAQTFYLRPDQRSEMLEQLRKDGAVWDYEVLLKKKDGTPLPVSMNSHLYFSPEGQELGVEGIFRDISERNASQECIHQHIQRIAEQSRELLEFIDHPPRLRGANSKFCAQSIERVG